ncbi:acyltransferase [Paenibacillus pini]|uniref:acyltransferase n=1 Tax=Paenibacillus pini TaxID=669461 RepID=UPI00056BD1F4|nr:acyltransferase [Paenibacillus pini]
MIKKERINELDVFRSFAIMAVVAIHATSQTLAATINTSSYYPFLFMNVFSKFAVPVFIFLSGFVLFYNYIDRPLDGATFKKFYTKRLLYILVPYFMFSAFYYALQLYRKKEMDLPFLQILRQFGVHLLKGTAHTHLYYVVIMIQLYVLFPLLLLLFQKQRKLLPWLAIIGFGIQWIFVYLYKYGFHLPQAGVVPQGIRNLPLPKGSIVLSYMAFFLFGAAIAVYYSRLKDWLIMTSKGFLSAKGIVWIILWLAWVVVGTIHVGLYYQLNTTGTSVNTLWYEFVWDIHSMLSAIVLMQLSFLLYRRGGQLLRRGLSSIGACSFGIFLLHPFLLFLYRKWVFHGGSLQYVGYIFLEWLVALVVSWIIVHLFFKYAKWSWIFFGSIPAMPKKQTINRRKENLKS